MAEIPEIDEGALIARCVEGDTEAFGRLVQAHQWRVRSYIGSFLDWPEVVDDLAQEVFLTAYADIRSYRKASAFTTWLLGIARHRVLRHLRSELRKTRLVDRLLDDERLAMLEADDTQLPEREQAIAALQRCLERLPPHSASMVRDRYFNANSMGEIARRLNKAEGALRIALFRIRHALRDCISRRMEEKAT